MLRTAIIDMPAELSTPAPRSCRCSSFRKLSSPPARALIGPGDCDAVGAAASASVCTSCGICSAAADDVSISARAVTLGVRRTTSLEEEDEVARCRGIDTLELVAMDAVSLLLPLLPLPLAVPAHDDDDGREHAMAAAALYDKIYTRISLP